MSTVEIANETEMIRRKQSLGDFDLDDDGAAELFGLELARIVVDGCFVAGVT